MPLRKPEVFCLSPLSLVLCRLLGHRSHRDVPFSGDEVCGHIAFSPEASLFPFLLLGSITRIPREEPFLYLRCDALENYRLVKS